MQERSNAELKRSRFAQATCFDCGRAHRGVHQLALDAVQRTDDGLDLTRDLQAVTALDDHLPHTAELALNPGQPRELG
jgi:hypothetical protein